MTPEPTQDQQPPAAGVVVQMRPRNFTDAVRAQSESALRCVSSGYLADGCSCPATIPSWVVAEAWARQRSRGEAGEHGLFRFAWQGEVWLAFSAAGAIRGVYCPTHLAEREARQTDTGMILSLVPSPDLAPAA